VSATKFRILLRNLMYLRNFEPVVRRLAENGHEILITTSVHDRKVPQELRDLADRLEADHANVRFGLTLDRADMWGTLARWLRAARNALRYRRPEYADAAALADRAFKRVDPLTRALVKLPVFRIEPLNRALTWLLTQCDRAIPADSAILVELRATGPDALIVSPLVDLQSEQVDWVRAARELDIPSCLLVASWDNLTNKGLIQARPDRVVVWNRFQKEEAVRMHGIDPDSVVLTGAQLYDHWFEREPSRDYAAFCEAFDFDPAKPTLLYCGSSVFIARNEAEFVERWLAKVRASEDARVREANVLIRPHPMHQVPFEHLDLSDHERVAVHPRKGGMPVLEDAKADYYDALYHSSAVVGINTSALIEASILGKRSFTVADPTYQRTQEGTLHFRYLIEGGILRKAPDFDAHIRQLSEELAAGSGAREEVRSFVESFLRPHGLEKPATPIVVETLEGLPQVHSANLRRVLRWALTALLAPFAWVAHQIATLRPRAALLAQRLLRRGLFMLAQLRKRDAIELLAIPQAIDYTGRHVEILATAPKEAATRTRSVMKEPWTVHWIEHAVKPGEVFYDIGANVGVYSLLVGAVHDKQVPAYAFEPGFSSYAALCRNVIHNGLDTCVVPLPHVLHRQVGHTTFKYRSTDSGAARHAVGGQNLETKDFKETKPVYQQTMLTVDLDTLVRDYGLPVPTHIKLDVDGPELEILEGARRTLADPGLKTVMVELDDKKTRRAIVALLEEAGLTLAREFDKAFSRGDPSFDAFFARDPEALREVMADSPIKPPREAADSSGDSQA
jgi:FkbM family methyltransferase